MVNKTKSKTDVVPERFHRLWLRLTVVFPVVFFVWFGEHQIVNGVQYPNKT